MFRSLLTTRWGHYGCLTLVMALLTLPNLGSASLWDIDEALNAEASREMLERGNWVVPTFNFELRTSKPVMINWLQMTSYSLFGVNEFAARLPSVLGGWLTVLLVYELARRMFGAMTGLLAGLVLASATEVCMLCHAATPDALLLTFMTLAYTVFWCHESGGSRRWWIPTAIACGLGVLTKGPVGVAMPALVIFGYFAWNRELWRLWDRRLISASLVFLAVVLPWYILIAVETRGQFIKEFVMRDNVGRFVAPMENHRGPIFYHILTLLVLYAPWCIFLGATLVHGIRQARVRPTAQHPELDLAPEQTTHGVRAYRFLIVWFLTYLVFFSIAATKLPNYILPLYPALAILTARLLERWRLRCLEVPRWLAVITFGGLLTVGAITSVGLMLVSGMWKLPVGKLPNLSGVEQWAFLGLIPITAAIVSWVLYLREQRTGTIATMVVGAIAFVGLLAGGGSLAFDAHKAPRALLAESGADQPNREIRLGSLVYFQPSLVFYAQREVQKLHDPKQASDLLSLPVPVYVFVEEKIWEGVRPSISVACQPVARHWDLYKNGNILVVWNGR